MVVMREALDRRGSTVSAGIRQPQLVGGPVTPTVTQPFAAYRPALRPRHPGPIGVDPEWSPMLSSAAPAQIGPLVARRQSGDKGDWWHLIATQ